MFVQSELTTNGMSNVKDAKSNKSFIVIVVPVLQYSSLVLFLIDIAFMAVGAAVSGHQLGDVLENLIWGRTLWIFSSAAQF